MKQSLSIFFLMICTVWLFSCSGGVSNSLSKSRASHDQHNETSGYNHLKTNNVGKCYALCLLPDGRESRWIEVICDKDVTDKLLRGIATSLFQAGYLAKEDINLI